VNTAVGQAGEYLTAALLIDLGVQCMVSPTDGADLLAYAADRYWRVEVKTSSKTVTYKNSFHCFSVARGSRNKRLVTSETCDIVALCALPLRRTIFKHVDQCKALNLRVPVDKFVEGCERQTWKVATSWT
tara:strand:- start:23 stop:412 length:390 start_codon:yes stop_codon:yes gene_type:complete